MDQILTVHELRVALDHMKDRLAPYVAGREAGQSVIREGWQVVGLEVARLATVIEHVLTYVENLHAQTK